jgi:hypothetical protein
MVYGQERDNSCGLASIMMCVFKINKLKPGAAAVTVEEDIDQKYEAAIGKAYDSETTGTFPDKLASVLNTLTSGRWKAQVFPPQDVPQKLIDRIGITSGMGPTVNCEPVIVGVDWDLGGAHWVVVDSIRQFMGSTYATICDPWDANLHVQSFEVGKTFYYDAASGGFSINFGGETKGDDKPYVGRAAHGQVKTWGMIFRE